MHKIRDICGLCASEREVLEETSMQRCSNCDVLFEAQTVCRQGHYICGTCREALARKAMIAYCLESDAQDVYALVVALMKLEHTAMHGPEHHLLLPAALLTAYKNRGGEIVLEEALEEANRRSGQIPGGACGHWGACGAALGAGIFLSIVLEASPLSEREWHLAGQLTARCIDRISAQGGPRCCKRDTFLALGTVLDFIDEHLGLSFALPVEIRCEFFVNNAQCKTSECPFFGVNRSRSEDK